MLPTEMSPEFHSMIHAVDVFFVLENLNPSPSRLLECQNLPVSLDFQ